MYTDRTLKALTASKQQDYLNEAERYRLLREGRVTWRYRVAENLIGLAGRLSPDHRSLLHRLGQSQRTITAEAAAAESVTPC